MAINPTRNTFLLLKELEYGNKTFIPLRNHEYSRNDILRAVCASILDKFRSIKDLNNENDDFFTWRALLSSGEFIRHFRGATTNNFRGKEDSIRQLTGVKNLFNDKIGIDTYPNAVCVFQDTENAYSKETNSHLSTMSGSGQNVGSRLLYGGETFYYINPMERVAISSNLVNASTICSFMFQTNNIDDINLMRDFLAQILNNDGIPKYYEPQNYVRMFISPEYSQLLADVLRAEGNDEEERLDKLEEEFTKYNVIAKTFRPGIVKSKTFKNYMELIVPYGNPMFHYARNASVVYRLDSEPRREIHKSDSNQAITLCTLEFDLRVDYQMPTSAYVYTSPNRMALLRDKKGVRLDRKLRGLSQQNVSSMRTAISVQACPEPHASFARKAIKLFSSDLAFDSDKEDIDIEVLLKMGMKKALTVETQKLIESILKISEVLTWDEMNNIVVFHLYEAGYFCDFDYMCKEGKIIHINDLVTKLPYYCELFYNDAEEPTVLERFERKVQQIKELMEMENE